MLSYQHSYHAGCLADVHKHAVMSVLLSILIQKDKPLTYFETHAGRGLYDLTSDDALKTGEAKLGIQKLMDDIDSDHPYKKALQVIHDCYGANAYPGSPMIAANILRDIDRMHLMELHPGEIEHLREAMNKTGAKIHHRDGYEGVLALSPPNPARGIALIDPSYEVKTEYDAAANFIQKLHKKWPVGVIALWYPILPAGLHKGMCEQIRAQGYPKILIQEIMFPSLKDRPGMDGSGMIVINAPYGLAEAFEKIPDLFSNA